MTMDDAAFHGYVDRIMDATGRTMVAVELRHAMETEVAEVTAYAEQFKREAEVYAAERDMAQAHRDRCVDILTRIYAKLGAESFTRDGVTYTFEPKDKAFYWPVYNALCAEIRAIPDELTKAAVAALSIPSVAAQSGSNAANAVECVVPRRGIHSPSLPDAAIGGGAVRICRGGTNSALPGVGGPDRYGSIDEQLDHALRTMVVAVDPRDAEEFPGHHKAYLEGVALPRARAALKAYRAARAVNSQLTSEGK